MRFLTIILVSLVLVACDDDDDDSDGDSVSVDVESEDKISSAEGGFEVGLDSGDKFGRALANLGNLDDDNSIDIGVGAPGDDRDGDDRGAVWILFLDEDRSDVVRDQERIADDDGGFDGDLDDNDEFGSALATLDGVTLGLDDEFETVLAVGAPGDDDGGDRTGAVWLLALDDDGAVEKEKKISFNGDINFSDLRDGDEFGSAVANIGDRIGDDDRRGDDIDALAVGSPRAKLDNSRKGVVWILFIEADDDIDAFRRIPGEDDDDFQDDLSEGDRFGSAIAKIGDLDDDNVTDIAVGAPGDGEGAVWILFMNEDGSVRERQKISEDSGNFFGDLDDEDRFGAALAGPGNLDGDDVPDLVVGAPGDTGDKDRPGALWILFLDDTGEVLAESKITRNKNGFDGDLDNGDGFGSALADLDDFDDDNSTELDLAVGAPGDDDREGDGDGDDNSNRGAVWLLSADVESDDTGGLLSSNRGRSDSADSLLEGPLRDSDFGSPLSDARLSSPLRDGGLSGPFRDGGLSGPLRDGGLSSPLRDNGLSGPLRDRELTSPLR